jgi:hypothetical protein
MLGILSSIWKRILMMKNDNYLLIERGTHVKIGKDYNRFRMS